MNSLKTIKIVFLLIFTISLTNCGGDACKTELDETKQKLADIEKALDTPFPSQNIDAPAFDFCKSDKAISRGYYNSLTGNASYTIPVPKDLKQISAKQNGNTVDYVFEGETYNGDVNYINYNVLNLSREPKSELIINVTFKFTKDDCKNSGQTERHKKSAVGSVPQPK